MNNEKMTSIAIILVSLSILVLFWKGQISSFFENREIKSNLSIERDELKEEYEKISAIDWYLKWTKSDKELENFISKSEISKLKEIKLEIPKYVKEVKENEVLKFIYGEIYKLNSNKLASQITINSISISEPKENIIKFLESDITLNLQVPSRDKLKDILNVFTKTSEYKFFITSLNFDDSNLVGGNGFSVTIPLKILHK